MRLPMDALAEAKAMVSRKPIAVVLSSDSEGGSKGVARRPYYQPCGQQTLEFYCNAPEHISLDELDNSQDVVGDAASAGATGDGAEGAASVSV